MNLLEVSNYDLESMHLDWCRADMLRRVALGVYGTSNFWWCCVWWCCARLMFEWCCATI
jgi:hypothetical protein